LFRTHPHSRHSIAKARELGAAAIAVVYPCSADALAGALAAADARLIKPTLIGPLADSPAGRIVLAAVACLWAHQHKETRA
jgi:hypothetical protein